jgi:hypothetical protein
VTRVPLLWKIAGSLLALPVLVLGTYQAVGALAHERSTETTAVDAAPISTIEVHNSAGSVRVIGVDGGDRITVRARISDSLRPTEHDVATEGERLVVTGSCPIFGGEWCSVSYTIEAPPDVGLEIRADGGIEVAGMDGDVRIATDQGRVTLDDIGGDVRATSDQGAILGSGLRASRVLAHTDQGRVTLRFGDPPRAVDAQSDQGSIEIVLPHVEGVAYRTDTDSDQGTVSDPIDQSPSSSRTLRAHSDQGDVTLRYAARG